MVVFRKLRGLWLVGLIFIITSIFVITPSYAQDGTATPTPESEPEFEIGNDLTINTLLEREIEGSHIIFEEKLVDGTNYSRHLVSYMSDGHKIYGLLTIPFGEVPENGFKAIVFNHGFIPPTTYRTTERYIAYVDTLARHGFVVFKIDMRGHHNSEGIPEGSYFSPGYTIDAISALKSLQLLSFIDADGIGMWGHSMAGNLVLRAMLIEPDIKAGVIWAGAVYSYDDFAQYQIDDPSFDRSNVNPADESPSRRRGRELRETYGDLTTETPYWQAVSLTERIDLLNNPIQLHHAANDGVVNIGYSVDLAAVLAENEKLYEFHRYESGGHNIDSPSFELAMQRTVAFFKTHL